MADLIDAYFDASDQAAIDAAETQVRAASRGVLGNVGTPHPSRGAQQRWLGGLARTPRGLRSDVLFGETEEERATWIAHVELAVAVPHPAGSGVTKCVPVAPLGLRAPMLADGALGEPPCDALYRGMWRMSSIADRVEQTHRDEVVVRIASALVALREGWRARTWSAWEQHEVLPPSPVEPAEPQPKPYDPASIWAFRIFEDGTGLVGFARALVIFRLRDGKVLRTLPTGNAEVVCAPTPSCALLKAFAATGAMRYDGEPERVQRLFTMDLKSGRWTARDDTPAIWFEEHQERSILIADDGRRLQLPVGDYPVVNELSPDHRFVWVEDKHGDGGLFRLRDGAFVTAWPEPTLDGEVPHLDANGKLAARRIGVRSEIGPAIVRSPRGTWLTVRDGVVCEDGRPILTVAGKARLAAFAPDGNALWIADAKTVRCIELCPAPKLRASWPYSPLRTAAGAPARLRAVRL